MSTLDDLLCNVGTVISTSSNNNQAAVDEVKLNYCCDVVLSKDSKKFILGTNQLFPIYDVSYINGAVHDIQMYLYTAVTWRDMFYTDMGYATHATDDPEAYLGYGGGIDVFDYNGGSPCVANSISCRDLTIDEWCRLTHNALPASPKHVLPRIWRRAEGGHKFWTPTDGIISALPVNIPMILESAEEFSSLTRYNLGGSVLASKIRAMLYNYMTENNVNRLYVGYEADLLNEPETHLIDAYSWSSGHRRRIGEMPYNENNFFGQLGDSKLRHLSIAINNKAFTQERVFA